MTALRAQPIGALADPAPLADVIHIDVVPQYTDQAVSLLKTFRKESLADQGAKRIDILQQVGRPNHFTVVEEWLNQSFYDKHVRAAHTLRFRTDIAPMPGAPFDEHPHLSIH